MRQRPSAEPVAFSTAGLPESRRIELWESHNAAALIGLSCRTLSGDVLEATEINVQLERIHLARVRGTAHVVERDQALVRHRPADSVALFFSLAGESFFYHDDGVRVVQPGEMLMCDADRPFLRGFPHGLEELVVKVPRDVFAGATGVALLERPVVVPFAGGGNPFGRALAREAGAAARADDPRPADEDTLLELIAAVAGPDRGDLPAAYRAAARGYIDRHLADAGLAGPAGRGGHRDQHPAPLPGVRRGRHQPAPVRAGPSPGRGPPAARAARGGRADRRGGRPSMRFRLGRPFLHGVPGPLRRTRLRRAPPCRACLNRPSLRLSAVIHVTRRPGGNRLPTLGGWLSRLRC